MPDFVCLYRLPRNTSRIGPVVLSRPAMLPGVPFRIGQFGYRGIVTVHTSVGGDRLPGDVAGVVGGQKGDRRGDIRRLSEVVDGVVFAKDGADVFRQRPRGGRSQYQPGRNGVAADSQLAVLRCDVPRQADDTGLRRSVPRKSPSRPPIDAVFTIEPLLRSVISDSAACVVAMTLRRLRWNTSSK